jgi:hypothetical protein
LRGVSGLQCIFTDIRFDCYVLSGIQSVFDSKFDAS